MSSPLKDHHRKGNRGSTGSEEELMSYGQAPPSEVDEEDEVARTPSPPISKPGATGDVDDDDDETYQEQGVPEEDVIVEKSDDSVFSAVRIIGGEAAAPSVPVKESAIRPEPMSWKGSDAAGSMKVEIPAIGGKEDNLLTPAVDHSLSPLAKSAFGDSNRVSPKKQRSAPDVKSPPHDSLASTLNSIRAGGNVPLRSLTDKDDEEDREAAEKMQKKRGHRRTRSLDVMYAVESAGRTGGDLSPEDCVTPPSPVADTPVGAMIDDAETTSLVREAVEKVLPQLAAEQDPRASEADGTGASTGSGKNTVAGVLGVVPGQLKISRGETVAKTKETMAAEVVKSLQWNEQESDVDEISDLFPLVEAVMLREIREAFMGVFLKSKRASITITGEPLAKSTRIGQCEVLLEMSESAIVEERFRAIQALLHFALGGTQSADMTYSVELAEENSRVLYNKGVLDSVIMWLITEKVALASGGNPESKRMVWILLNLLYLLVKFNKTRTIKFQLVDESQCGQSVISCLLEMAGDVGTTYPLRKVLLVLSACFQRALGTLSELSHCDNEGQTNSAPSEVDRARVSISREKRWGSASLYPNLDGYVDPWSDRTNCGSPIDILVTHDELQSADDAVVIPPLAAKSRLGYLCWYEGVSSEKYMKGNGKFPHPIAEGIDILRGSVHIQGQYDPSKACADRPQTGSSTTGPVRKTGEGARIMELLYRSLLPALHRHLISLLRILLAASPTIKQYQGTIDFNSELSYDVKSGDGTAGAESLECRLFELKIPHIEEISEAETGRQKSIIIKAISTILLVFLKACRRNHEMKYQYVSQMLVDSNCLLLILKVLNQEPMVTLTAPLEHREWWTRINEDNHSQLPAYMWGVLPCFSMVAKLHSIDPSALSPTKSAGIAEEMNNERLNLDSVAAQDAMTERSRSDLWIQAEENASKSNNRNFVSMVYLLRCLQKLTKRHHSRIQILVKYKAPTILKRLFKLNQKEVRFYTLKVLKSQAKYLGKAWRKNNMRIISAIYNTIRLDLHDDWLHFGVYEEKLNVEELEKTSKSDVHSYHMEHYSSLVSDPTGAMSSNSDRASGPGVAPPLLRSGSGGIRVYTNQLERFSPLPHDERNRKGSNSPVMVTDNHISKASTGDVDLDMSDLADIDGLSDLSYSDREFETYVNLYNEVELDDDFCKNYEEWLAREVYVE